MASSSRPSHNPPADGGFKYNPPNGGPADTNVTGAIEKSANAILADDLRGREAHSVRARAQCLEHSSSRLHRRLRERSRKRGESGSDSRRGRSHRRRSARRRGRALLGTDHRALPHQRDGRERCRRSYFSFHDRGLGRQDPHGLLVAVCDGAAGRDEGPLRRRIRQRHRQRSPRHRHAERGPDESRIIIWQ